MFPEGTNPQTNFGHMQYVHENPLLSFMYFEERCFCFCRFLRDKDLVLAVADVCFFCCSSTKAENDLHSQTALVTAEQLEEFLILHAWQNKGHRQLYGSLTEPLTLLVVHREEDKMEGNLK